MEQRLFKNGKKFTIHQKEIMMNRMDMEVKT